MEFSEVVKFHGHVCPGLAMGYRVSQFAKRQLAISQSADEEVVAVVENNSCAIDAIQMVTGCTFGKGNLIFHDHGKQVYTFMKRKSGESVRVAVKWTPPTEDMEVAANWQKYTKGDRTPAIMKIVKAAKLKKAETILDQEEKNLFTVSTAEVNLPPKAQVHLTMTCDHCLEKVMEPKLVNAQDGSLLCIPCAAKST